MTTTILLVEDEAPIQELLRFSLEQASYAVNCCDSAEQAGKQIQQELPDLILLDWMLPKMSGLDFARQLRTQERTRHIPLIMLTARSAENDKIAGLEIGADDYITKPFSPKELLARIKAVLRRRAPQATDDLVTLHDLVLDPKTHKVTGASTVLNLGPTEFRLLHFLMTHAERVHSRTQLLDKVWGDHVFVEERTVDVHIRRLRSALSPSGHDRFVQTVRGAGYLFSAKIHED